MYSTSVLLIILKIFTEIANAIFFSDLLFHISFDFWPQIYYQMQGKKKNILVVITFLLHIYIQIFMKFGMLKCVFHVGRGIHLPTLA